MKNLFCALGCISILAACSSVETASDNTGPKAEYHKLSAAGLVKMLSEISDYTVLDVRTEREYRKRHIKDAVWIPFTQVQDRAEKELPDKNKVIFVHCRYGGRSTVAAKKLVKMGYMNVYDFKCINSWPKKEDMQE